MRSDVRQIRIDGQHYKTLVHTHFVEAVMSIDVDIQSKTVYLADIGNQSIVKVSLENPNEVEYIVTSVQRAEGIAFDWISRNIYWTSVHPKCKSIWIV